nr:MAG TPA: Protein of unknown function (DUF551) [Caudoviricetes sp.]
MRLIDADKLSDYLQNHYNEVEALHRPNDSEYLCGIGTCLDSIDAYSFEVPDTYPAWISVKDELPAIGEPVLVFDDASDMMFGFMSSDGYWLETGSELPCNVTHWMPLPEPPKE